MSENGVRASFQVEDRHQKVHQVESFWLLFDMICWYCWYCWLMFVLICTPDPSIVQKFLHDLHFSTICIVCTVLSEIERFWGKLNCSQSKAHTSQSFPQMLRFPTLSQNVRDHFELDLVLPQTFLYTSKRLSERMASSSKSADSSNVVFVLPCCHAWAFGHSPYTLRCIFFIRMFD